MSENATASVVSLSVANLKHYRTLVFNVSHMRKCLFHAVTHTSLLHFKYMSVSSDESDVRTQAVTCHLSEGSFVRNGGENGCYREKFRNFTAWAESDPNAAFSHL